MRNIHTTLYEFVSQIAENSNSSNPTVLDESNKYGSFEGVIHYNMDNVKNWFGKRHIDYSKYLSSLELPIAFLNNINVEKRFRNKGHGSDLYVKFEEECYENNAYCIILECDNGEIQKKGFDLKSWYESFDFEIKGEESGNYIMIKIL